MMERENWPMLLEKDNHSVVVSMVDQDGLPISAYMDVMLADASGVYFLTSNNGRNLYHDLNRSRVVSVCGKTDGDYFHAKMVSLKGKIRNIGKDRVDELIERNPYMKKLYPDEQPDRRKILDVFQIYEGKGTFQEFSANPPIKVNFVFGK